LQGFCLFIGYPRSGHSLVGALIDAHPDAAIAHEAHALRLAAEGSTREALFERLLENTTYQAGRKRKASGYKYVVEGQWQGAVRTLRVIGDKDGSKTTRRAKRDPEALPALERVAGLPLRIIHVTRNPYDMVARIALITKGGVQERPVAKAIPFVKRLARTNESIIAGGRYQVLTVRHEALIHDPQANLRAICDFLGLDGDDDYVESCAELVFESPHHTRELVEWSDDERVAVAQLIEEHSFFDGYGWESDN
jgi:hypothetical protein